MQTKRTYSLFHSRVKIPKRNVIFSHFIEIIEVLFLKMIGFVPLSIIFVYTLGKKIINHEDLTH